MSIGAPIKVAGLYLPGKTLQVGAAGNTTALPTEGTMQNLVRVDGVIIKAEDIQALQFIGKAAEQVEQAGSAQEAVKVGDWVVRVRSEKQFKITGIIKDEDMSADIRTKAEAAITKGYTAAGLNIKLASDDQLEAAADSVVDVASGL
ncbi:hypothetical protein ACFL96_01750 [Thermoproteota archaeon]